MDLENDLGSTQKEHDSLKEKIVSLETNLKSHCDKLSQFEQEKNLLKETIEKLKKGLEEEDMNDLLSGDQGFEKAKAQTLSYYPNLDLAELDYFKVVVDKRLVDEVDPEPNPYSNASQKTKFVAKDQASDKTNIAVERRENC